MSPSSLSILFSIVVWLFLIGLLLRIVFGVAILQILLGVSSRLSRPLYSDAHVQSRLPLEKDDDEWVQEDDDRY